MIQAMQYRIGEHVLDPRKFELRKNGCSVPAEPQVLSLLFHLVENRDRLVSKDELVDTIWGGRAVSDSAISSRIKSARQLLDDDGEAQRLIRTVHGKGFRFVGDVSVDASVAEAGDPPAQDSISAAAPAESGKRRVLPAALGLGALLLVGLLVWHPWAERPVTVIVEPATAAPQSDLFARDLTAKLGMLSSVSEGSTRLLDRTAWVRPDLRFDVDASTDSSDVTSTVMLSDDRGEILWSKDFRQPRAKLSDLKQQLAYAAAKVLNCALDTVAEKNRRLDRQVVKLYLNGCAESADAEENIPEIERTFKKVVDAAPGFEPGWRRLLIAEAATLDDHFDPSEADVSRGRQTLAAARKAYPGLPESYVLEAETVQPTAMDERMRLMEKAVHAAPDDGDIAVIESVYLTKVGRVKDAVAAAKRAVRNDPLSPVNREAVVFALGYDGRIAEAEQALREAEALWPSATTLRTARFTLYLRFADPKQAIRLRESGLPMPLLAPFVGSFLAARADPSPANVELALRDARALYARTPIAISHLQQTLGEFHREEELFPILLNWQYPDKVDQITDALFRPALRNFRHDPRFIRVAERLGLLQYWQSSGKWPDFCFDADLPYDCKRVAAQVVPTA